ncbi:mRNA splicing protein YJU2 [Lachancea thermotolerans CBS 6340]|uniref:KLTH0D05720p n=1 Tax=Lachancea thermotolerans (strain ATCC 56472 / CBS 6340 / NRRL Y-8284) TaxID=559295 RepID=C5DGJ1_LACTC|nr:KLTH0D05720p [Lachancea thermotolerans CBS 6340]CAR22533.1 KLTH0D05720p [Lachancea thermotolerans CBS 6340]
MSERKAINKYYPPNFNPLEAEEAARKLSKKLKTMNRDVITIRLMTPFSMRCLKCSEFIPKSRKFNGKKELLPEKYLDTIKQYRLSIKCPRCNNMIAFRTDPKSGDYVMEIGGVKNFVEEKPEEKLPGDETLDETLERLERQQQQDNNQTKNDDHEDKLEKIEKRLAKLQKEQQDYEELEALRRENISKMKKAEALQEKSHLSAQEESQGDEEKAELAFRLFNAQKADGETSGPAVHITAAPAAIPQKIRSKKKAKSNALGVIVKKKNRARQT